MNLSIIATLANASRAAIMSASLAVLLPPSVEAQNWSPGVNSTLWTDAKVGIGVNQSADKLNVIGTVGISGTTAADHTALWLRAGSNGGDRVRVGFRGDNGGEYAQIVGAVTTPISGPGTASGGKLIFRTASGGTLRDHVTFDETGTIVFGTPGAGLDAYAILVDGGGGSINNGNGRDLTVRAGSSDNNAAKSGGNLILRPGPPTSPATAFGKVLLADIGGKVVIGTTDATEKVNVEGNVRVTGTVDAGSIRTRTWTVAPDYVFEKDYKLRSLDEVDSFVKKNKHLPEVPSAKEFKEKGMDLAEMNFVLLKKVEELTLHSIEQHKRSKAQEREILALKKALSSLTGAGN